MKTFLRFTIATAFLLMTELGCFAQHYNQTNLVSNTSGAPVTDPQLINPWGLSRGSGSEWGVSDNATGFSTLYDGAGAKQSLIATTPPADPNNKKTPVGSPTGTIFNGSQTYFLLAPGKPAAFPLCNADGTTAGWNPTVALAQGATPPSTQAVTVVKTSDGSAYTGLTSAFIDGKRYLYVANFGKGRVDVFDNAFKPVNLSKGQVDQNSSERGNGNSAQKSFLDEKLPNSHAPFNVQPISYDIFVTYVLHEEDSPLESHGPGFAYVT